MKKRILVVFLSMYMAILSAFAVDSPENPGKETGSSRKVMTEGDCDFMESVLSVYDGFVRSKTDDLLPIAEAYSQFFSVMNEKMQSAGDIVMIVPDSVHAFDFMYYFIGGAHADNSFARPRYTGLRPNNLAPGITPGLANWRFVFERSAFELLNEVAERNPFWKGAKESRCNVGEFSAADYAEVVMQYDEIDFGDEQQRFVVALMFLELYLRNERAFELQADIIHNDSIFNYFEQRLKKTNKNDNNGTN